MEGCVGAKRESGRRIMPPPSPTRFINWQLRFNEWRTREAVAMGRVREGRGDRLDTTVARNNVFAER